MVRGMILAEQFSDRFALFPLFPPGFSHHFFEICLIEDLCIETEAGPDGMPTCRAPVMEYPFQQWPVTIRTGFEGQRWIELVTARSALAPAIPDHAKMDSTAFRARLLEQHHLVIEVADMMAKH